MKRFINIFPLLNAIALFLAVETVNSTCAWVMYQPEVPEELEEYKIEK